MVCRIVAVERDESTDEADESTDEALRSGFEAWDEAPKDEAPRKYLKDFLLNTTLREPVGSVARILNFPTEEELKARSALWGTSDLDLDVYTDLAAAMTTDDLADT